MVGLVALFSTVAVVVAIVAIPPAPKPFTVGFMSFTDCAAASDLQQEIAQKDIALTRYFSNQTFSDSAPAREFASQQGLDLLMWGICRGDNTLELHGEIMTQHRPPSVFDLLSPMASVSAVQLNAAESLSEALVYYGLGGTENFGRAAETLRSLPFAAESAFLRANSRLFQGFEHYDEALESYQQILDSFPQNQGNQLLRASVLNNMGVTSLNQAQRYLDAEDRRRFDPAVEAARNYFSDALEAAAGDTALLDVIHVNHGTSYYFFPGENYLVRDYETAQSECGGVKTAQGYICHAAAHYYLLYDNPEISDPCEPIPNLEPLLDDLARAEEMDSTAAELYYWQFRVNNFRLECADPSDEELRASYIATSNGSLNTFHTLMASREALLVIDRHFLETRPIGS